MKLQRLFFMVCAMVCGGLMLASCGQRAPIENPEGYVPDTRSY